MYLTSKIILNQGSSLDLGTLTANGGFTVASVSGLKLLNVGANDTQTVIYDTVSIGSGTGSGGPGAGLPGSRVPGRRGRPGSGS